MFKIKITKKIITLTSIFALTLICIGGIKASAKNPTTKNNYKDTPYNFTFDTNYTSCTTNIRAKEDTSKAYIKCSQTKQGFYVQVWGSSKGDWFGPKTANCSYGNTAANEYGAHIQTGTTKYLQSLVKERGYNYAFLKCYTAPILNGGIYNPISFVWSPDNYRGL